MELILVFKNLGKLSWIMRLEIIWNIHRKSLRQKGINLLTSARGKFRMWNMAGKKIRTYERRRIDGSHNVVYDVVPNVAVLDVGLRNNDVDLSYNGSIGSSSSSVFTNSV